MFYVTKSTKKSLKKTIVIYVITFKKRYTNILIIKNKMDNSNIFTTLFLYLCIYFSDVKNVFLVLINGIFIVIKFSTKIL